MAPTYKTSEFGLPITLQILLVNLAFYALIGVLGFLARHWLAVRIERAVQARFDEKLERLRSELRNREEEVKKALRASEGEINALRNSLLGSAASYREIVHKRQFEAIDKIWSAVVRLAPLDNLASMMSIIKLEETTEFAKINNTPISAFFKGLLETVPKDFSSTKQDWATSEQPFVSELLWAYFSCYKSVVSYFYMRAKEFEIGITTGGTLTTNKHIDGLLRKTLPNWIPYMDKFGTASYFYLLDPIKELLLAEIRATLSGVPASEENVNRARELLFATRALEKDLSEERAG